MAILGGATISIEFEQTFISPNYKLIFPLIWQLIINFPICFGPRVILFSKEYQ